MMPVDGLSTTSRWTCCGASVEMEVWRLDMEVEVTIMKRHDRSRSLVATWLDTNSRDVSQPVLSALTGAHWGWRE